MGRKRRSLKKKGEKSQRAKAGRTRKRKWRQTEEAGVGKPHLFLKDSLRGGGGVDAGGFDGDNNVPAVLEEVMGVQRDNTGLVWLCHVRKNRVHHADCTAREQKEREGQRHCGRRKPEAKSTENVPPFPPPSPLPSPPS